MTERTWSRIEDARERWNVLRHPFYRRWSAGELSAADLACYSGQYRHAVEAVATLSDSVADSAPERPELGRHAEEERDHVALWDGFVEAAGGTPGAEPTAETTACVREWTDGGAGLPERLITLYAIESGQPEISRTKLEGLLGSYGFEDGPATEYFRVHERRDVEHAAEARELVDEVAEPADEDRLVAAAEAAFRANWRLLDGV
ncbi:MAG: iron-containing redox enzyme family protein [Solirubrobacterales bacterium]